ncbi:MAG TPA: ABC transporter ATP-binding protein [Thermoanaerobaculia bacterium]|nr:ABC transporter ATP-binding protein [Thermoanaerobaculia bacterium]
MTGNEILRESRAGRQAGPIAELLSVSKNYGSVAALSGVDFAVRAGEVVAVLGPNGAGKTTAVHLLLGLARPTAGTVRLFGLEPRHSDARTRVGAMLQISKVPETLKVKEHLELTRSYYPRPMPLPELVAAAGLGGLEERPFGKLSGGQRQRVLFALALCGDPDLLFLDEPTASLDVEARRGLWASIAQRTARGGSVLLTTHHLEEADALAGRIVLLDRGRIIAEGTPSEIKARVPGRKVRCRTRLAEAELLALPGVRSVHRNESERSDGGERSEVEIFASAAERLVGELLARDPELTGLEVHGADLEEAFLALTSRGAANASPGPAGRPPVAEVPAAGAAGGPPAPGAPAPHMRSKTSSQEEVAA